MVRKTAQEPTTSGPDISILKSCLIVGGTGFLGSVTARFMRSHAPNCTLSVIDLRLPEASAQIPGVAYYSGSINDKEELGKILKKVGPQAVLHMASPMHGGHGKELRKLYKKVNVEGTRTLLECCAEAGVKAFVLTSSASVIYDGEDIKNGNEEYKVVFPNPVETYVESKAEGEMLTLAYNNTKNGMLTCALRPSGIFGPNDTQVAYGFINVLKGGKARYQLGDNSNLFDFTYVDNVAYAHVLAALALIANDKVAHSAAGEAFFITNDQPIYFWDYARSFWREVGHTQSNYIVFPRPVSMFFAFCSQTVASVTGKKVSFDMYAAKQAMDSKWYDISKAKKILGYRPLVTMEEGIRMTMDAAREKMPEQYRGYAPGRVVD